MIVGERGYKKTFLVVGSAMTVSAPYLLLHAFLIAIFIQSSDTALFIANLIGILFAFIGGINVLIVEVMGLKVMHKLSTLKAIVAALIIPLILFFLVLLIITLVVVLLVVSFGMPVMHY